MRRVARIMSDEHRDIEAMRTALCKAIGDRSSTRARAAFDQYRAAISVHFAVEEDVLFPEISDANPDEKPEIERLVQAHDRLLEELVEMGDQLEALAGEDFSRRLDGHATIFALCESSEEALASRVAAAGAD
jgi:iron-sulfur cluster repair protein YtfE (RIC family)